MSDRERLRAAAEQIERAIVIRTTQLALDDPTVDPHCWLDQNGRGILLDAYSSLAFALAVLVQTDARDA